MNIIDSPTKVVDEVSPPPQIEITPEMIVAGAEVILEAYGGLDLSSPPTDVAARVFRAMSRLDASIPGPRHAQMQP